MIRRPDWSEVGLGLLFSLFGALALALFAAFVVGMWRLVLS